MGRVRGGRVLWEGYQWNFLLGQSDGGLVGGRTTEWCWSWNGLEDKIKYIRN
jgi:hypothetical protein